MVSGRSASYKAGYPPNTVNGGTSLSAPNIELSKILQLSARTLLCEMIQFFPICTLLPIFDAQTIEFESMNTCSPICSLKYLRYPFDRRYDGRRTTSSLMIAYFPILTAAKSPRRTVRGLMMHLPARMMFWLPFITAWRLILFPVVVSR
jgi:hypothetical protein